MWGVAAIVSFALSLVLWLAQAQIHAGHILAGDVVHHRGLLCRPCARVAAVSHRRG